MNAFSTRLLALILPGLLALLPASAAPVTIGDPSFEGNSINAGGYTYNIGPEWTGTNGNNQSSAFEEFVTGFAAQGTDHLGMEQGYTVWQDLGVTYQPNTRYTLTVAAGRRGAGQTFSGNLTEYLLADSTGAVHASGSFDAFTNLASLSFGDAPALVLDTPNVPQSVGRTIRILLRAGGSGRSHFDNIRLDASTLVPPGAATVITQAATSVSSQGATLNGQVTSIGVGAPTVTVFWGTSPGGQIAANWPNSITLPATQSGSFSVPLTGLTHATEYHYTIRASNSAGDSWAPASAMFDTLPLLPSVINGPSSAITVSGATLSAEVTATGGENPGVTVYYGPADGGTIPANWASSISLGTVARTAAAQASGLTPGTTYFYRAVASNTAGTTWAPASSTFTTLVATVAQIGNLVADGLTGTTATLRGEILDDGNDKPVITFFYGISDGGTNPAAWSSSASLGIQSGDFDRFISGLTPGTTYRFRARAVNAAGTSWAPATATFTTTALVSSVPVIHEVHYHPADDASLGPLQTEFIELHNPGDSTVNLAGWRLTNAIEFTFPAGTTLAPGGFLVVSENPGALLAKHGVSSIGPWVGNLSSQGETIQLLNPTAVEIDRVSYNAGFPWPTAADGGGPSMELLHPSLDNDLGGSWRSSGISAVPAATYIAASSAAWKYKAGNAEASSPVDAWRQITYNDSTGWTTATAPFGYGGGYTLTTTLSGMRNSYRSVYFRKAFTIASSVPEQVTLNLRYDDACVAWINGVEVFRSTNAPSGQVPFNVNSGTSLADHPASAWESIPLNTVVGGTNILKGGSNVLCVHVLNQTLGSSDYYFDASLTFAGTGASTNPTPGAANAARLSASRVPPQIRQVSHSPAQPVAGTPVTVTAKITDPDGTGTVSLLYQTVDPGAYIRKTDSTYATAWTSVAMTDNGTGGDLLAGDSIFTAVLPAALQVHRRLIRYRISLADVAGNSLTVPYPDDEQPNFAYFVYNGTPAWSGAFNPGTTAVETYPSTLLESLPPLHIIANSADVDSFQSGNETRFQATAVQRGKVYDHVQFRARGKGSTTVSGKNKWAVYFNRSRDYQGYDNFGKPYKETWNNLLLNANSSPWASVHRGSAGIEEAVSNRIYQLAGLPAQNTSYLHLRVIDAAAESPTSQYAGDLWGLYLNMEPTEGNFLDERGLPDGNLYSIEGGAGDKKHQGPGQAMDSSDWSAFSSGVTQTGQTETWYRDNVDLPALYTFLALNRLIGNVDVRPGDNYRFYHRPTDNRWVIIPYDLDMQFIAAHHWGGNMDGVVVAGAPDVIRAISRHPNLAREYRNRCRELLSLMASDGGSTGGQIGQLFHEYARMVNPPGTALTWADLDAAMWNMHPNTKGSLGIFSGQSNHRGNFFRASYNDGTRGVGGPTITNSWIRTLPDPDANGFSDHESLTEWFIAFATPTYPAGAAAWVRKATPSSGGGVDTDANRQKGYGYKYLEWESLHGGYVNAMVHPTSPPFTDAPATPVLTALGDPAFPVSDLRFSSSAFSDPQGAANFAAWQWRIAEISAPGIASYVSGPCTYEIETLAQSAELTGTPGAFTIPLGVTKAGKTYRVRVRHKDGTGNWSAWSAPAQFTATTPPLDLVHYWNFNNPAALLTPGFSTGGASITTNLAGTTLVESGTGQGFAAANARLGDPAGSHMRINNPLGSTIDFRIPTTAHENLIVQYEARRSGQGAGIQQVSYTLDGTSFIPFATFTLADSTPETRILDFRDVRAADDNPNFGIRISFSQGTGGLTGNQRIDNLTVEGDALPPGFELWKLAHFSNPADLSDPAISGPSGNPSGDGVANLIRYAHGVGPFAPVNHLLPLLHIAGSTREFRFRYDPGKADLVWKVRASADLGDWSQVLFDSRTSPIPPADNGWIAIPVPAASSPDRRFLRLEVETISP